MPDQLNSISTIDGRYSKEAAILSNYFSESALMRYRVMVEVEYVIALSKEKKLVELPLINNKTQSSLRKIYQKFDSISARRIKKIETQTNHDVKAVEIFISEKLQKLNKSKLKPWVHFGLTSEDINNISYSMMWKDGIKNVYLDKLNAVIKAIKSLTSKHSKDAILSLTHGQPATPTTFGKEMAVFYNRLNKHYKKLKELELEGKISGATGTWAAHVCAYPEIDWLKFSKRLVKSFGLKHNPLTTQIESHDSLAEQYHLLSRVNSVLIDFSNDIWFYISRGILIQKKVGGETGSSTMPHKINPIHFENAEGNCGLGSALLIHLANKLTVSRLQRDLSGSTVIRNQGLALGYCVVALNNLIKGIGRIKINKHKSKDELNEHWEILAEAVQTILRKNGYPDAYEKIKELTRGESIDKSILQKIVSSLDISLNDKKRLMKLTPSSYTGLSSVLAKIR
ncbi:adenylosuccinate lyase [bacterium]|nr:MAG: adenylosuccinate lyase [bacterium]